MEMKSEDRVHGLWAGFPRPFRFLKFLGSQARESMSESAGTQPEW
jgi:hypothetical protein